MKQFGSHWTDFHEILYLIIFQNYIEKIQVSLKSDKKNGYLYMKNNITFLIRCRLVLLKIKNVSGKSCRENQNIHFMFSSFVFLRKSCRLLGNLEKYCRAAQTTEGSMPHAYCMLDT